jgi:hypothetical protein
MAEILNLDVTFLESCLACYLTDHHNRDGELLVGIPISNTTTFAEIKDDLFSELNTLLSDRNDVPAVLTEAAVGACVESLCATMDPEEPIDADAADEDDDSWTEGESDGGECQAWFLLTWNPDAVVVS